MRKQKTKKTRGNKDEEEKKNNPRWVGLRFAQPHGSENWIGALVGHSLVFLHILFGLSQFCKKPCNPVFNVLQFLKKVKKILGMFFVVNVLRERVASRRRGCNPGPPLQETEGQPLVYQALRRWIYFLDLLQTQSQKGLKFRNPAAEQRSSAQGCTVRPETSAGQSSLRGI